MSSPVTTGWSSKWTEESISCKPLGAMAKASSKGGQRASGRRMFLLAGMMAGLAPAAAVAQDKLDAGGLTFRDFSTNDNGASFSRSERDPIISGGPNQLSAKVASVEADKGLARIQFGSIRVEIAVPLG